MDARLLAGVRRRAAYRCEYCLLPEGGSQFEHEVDHIISKQNGGLTVWENLALACIHCNRYKGPSVAGVDPVTGQIIPLFNPRTDNWTDHFEWRGAVVFGRTPSGRATVRILRMSLRTRIETRAWLLAEGVRFDPIPRGI